METRVLGRTGHRSSVVIMGTAAFYTMDQAGADAALNLAEAHGVNHIDVAPQYGNAQQVLGPWLESRRERYFVSCKTLLRRADEAWDDLQNSLRLLRTDHIELYQFHAVGTWEELDEISGPGGALEAFRRARDEGIVRWLGITGHGLLAPAVHREALLRCDLDTVMFPVNARLYADAQYRRDAEALLQTAQERQAGVMAIKALAKAPWGDHRRYNSWYEPFDQPGEIETAVRFALSQPITALASAAEVALLPDIFRAAEQFTPLSPAEQDSVIAAHAADTPIFEGSQTIG